MINSFNKIRKCGLIKRYLMVIFDRKFIDQIIKIKIMSAYFIYESNFKDCMFCCFYIHTTVSFTPFVKKNV